MEPRRLNLLDSMILTAAVAVGVGAARWWYPQAIATNERSMTVGGSIDLVAWLLLPMSLALLAVGLRRPRPARRRLVREAGFQANLVVCLATLAALLANPFGFRPTWTDFLMFGIGNEQASNVGWVVAIGWTLTWLTGARRVVPGPIDRLGRALGWAWIALWVAVCVLIHLENLRGWLAPPVPSPLPSASPI